MITASAAETACQTATTALLAALPPILDAPPWELLGWTATLYLRPYLTASEHRAALRAALDRARLEAARRPRAPADQAWHDAELPLRDLDSSAWYRPIWSRAIEGGTAAHLLLAQHACELAELLDQSAVPMALRLGLALPLSGALCSATALPKGSTVLPTRPEPRGDELERLSRALLSHAIGRRTFADHLLTLHAGNRGVELTGGWMPPRMQAARLIGDLPCCERSPKRLRAVQPPELARRAVACSSRAVLMVEAGLAEAEGLANGQRLLLLAALDDAFRTRAGHDRY